MKKRKKIEKEFKESANRVWLAGLGALRVAEREGSKLFQSLVTQGEELEVKGKKRLEDLKKVAEDVTDKARNTADEELGRFEKMFDERLQRIVESVGVPGREEIRDLAARVEKLTVAVEAMRSAGESGATSAKTRTTKTAPRRRAATARKTSTATKTSATKTTTTKTTTTKPAGTKTAATRKPAAKKPAAKKAAAPKPAAGKTAVKTAVKKPAPTRSAAKKTVGKRSTATSTSKTAAAKKPAAKKPAAKRRTTKTPSSSEG